MDSIPVDHQLHAAVSYAIVATVAPKYGIFTGNLAALGFGALKEFVIDKQPDRNDVVADGVGIVTYNIIYYTFK